MGLSGERKILFVILALVAFLMLSSQTVSAITTVFEDNFTASGGFQNDTPNTAPWQMGSATQVSGCYSDSSCWGTNLASNYYSSGPYDDYLTQVNAMNFSKYTNITLTFYHYRYFESASTLWDAGVVDIDYNGSWTRLTPVGGYNGTVSGLAGSTLANQQAYGYHGSGWELATFNLSSYAGNNSVKIRFHFATDQATADRGWFIDNVKITGTDPLPASITNLANQSRDEAWIYWNWTNPSDSDFSQNIIFKDGVNIANTSNNYYNITGLSPSTSYTITVHTKDSAGNINSTDVNSTATTITTLPSVTGTVPTANTEFNVDAVIEISANATDSTNISTVYANVTLPNSTIQQVTLSQAGSTEKYNNSFTIPTLKGIYNITIFANDSFGNINSSETSYFNVSNTYASVINLSYPSNSANLNVSQIDFNFTVTDDNDAIIPNCSLYTNSSGTFAVEQTIYNVTNNTETNITVTMPDEDYLWNVECTDSGGLSKFFASNYTLTVDTLFDGLIVYQELDVQVPRHRIYSKTNIFGNEKATATTVGGDIAWIVTKANHDKNEFITGFEDKNKDINLQVFNGDTETWGNAQEVSDNVPNSAYRAFDIAYEDVSGDALIVYESSTLADNVLRYKIWNGTDYSNEQTLTTGLGNDNIRWVSLVEEQGTDYIMLLAHNSIGDLYAIPWNGTDFDSSMEIVASTSTNSSTEEHFSFAWEESSGEGLLVYGEGTDLVYRTFKKTAPQWSTGATIALGDGLDATRTCSDPTSNHIGVIWQDSGNDVNVRMWDGTVFLTSPPSEDTSTEGNGANNANIDCAWINSSTALFGFVDANALSMDYFTFSKSNTWSTSVLTSTSNTGNFASDDIKSLRFTRNLATNEVMVTTMDLVEDISLIRWNGTTFVNLLNPIIETNTEVINGAQEGVMFAWPAVDYTPNVTNVSPQSATVTAGNSVLINATVVDDGTIDTVLANITLPNGTIQQITLTDGDSDSVYNATFTGTSLPGTYSIKIIANDTSTHQNINSSETGTFTVPDTTGPAVTNLAPSAGTNYNVSESIEISANVSDPSNISSVSVNVTFPNGTIQTIALSNTTTTKYNNSFTVPGLLGTYNLTYFANDTSNNINSSETTNFTAVDNVPPAVTSLLPSQGTPVTALDVVEVAANVTDGLNVNATLANVTYPNGTVLELTLSQVGSTSKYNNSFSVPNLAGTFNITFFANDSNGNINSSETTFVDSSGDSENPQVTALIPANGTSADVSSSIEISANVADNIYLDSILVNLTHPNGTIEELTLTLATGAKYNTSYALSSALGTYTANFFANDTSGNINGSEQTVFTVTDGSLPSITTLGCVPDPVALSQSTICNATVTDDGALDTITANVTYPNGTIEAQSVSNVNSNYYFTFANTPTNGSYTVTWFANDTGGNSKTASETFGVADQTNPLLALNSPSNLTNITTTSQTFNFTASDNYDSTLSCSVYLDNVLNQTNSSTANNTATILTITGIAEGTHTWNINCSDGAGNLNVSETRTVKVDLSAPTFNTLTTSPSDSASLDPNVNITVSANVTENVTSVDTVLLQTKTSGASTYTNTTMTFNSSTNLYVATFNATSTATYNLRLYANDTMGNSGYSTVVNRVVQLDKTWTRSPASFTPINVVANTSSLIGNLVINNTGDVSLNFSVASDSSNAAYNDTVNFTLSSGAVRVMTVNDSVPIGGVSTTTFNISSNTSGVSPASQTTTAILVVTDQPTLINEITNPTLESINRTLGATGVAFTSTLTNAGNKSATNVIQTFTIPSDWTLTFGSLTNDVGTLVASGTEEFTIEVTIPSNATTGTKTVTANATGTNTSGTDLASLGFIFGDSVTVNVDDGTTETITSGSSSSSTSSTVGSVGGGSSAASSGSSSSGGSFSSSENTIEIVRGTNTTITINITNDDPNSTLTNLTPQAFGELAQFVTFTPSHVDKLEYEETVYFTALVAPPSYLGQEDYELKVKVSGSLVTGAITKSFSRVVFYNFLVREISSSEASKYLNESITDVKAMADANFTTARIQLLLDNMKDAFSVKDFTNLRKLRSEIHQRRISAFNVFELFREVEDSIQKAELSGVSVPRTRELFYLARAAFDREDYTSALQRAKDAQFSVLLESKGHFDLVSFLIDWWWAVILGSIISIFAALLIYKRMFTAFVKQRINNLNKEEETLTSLLKEAQKKHFEKGEMSSEDYKQMSAQYKTRLIKISQIRNKLRHKRARIVRTESEIKQLEAEGKDIVQMIKKLQAKYYQDRSITPDEYQRGIKSNESALAELEDERATLETRISKEIGTNKYKILRFIQERILSRSPRSSSKKTDKDVRRKLKKKLKGKWVKIKIKGEIDK